MFGLKQRPLQPFEFRGEIPPEPSYVELALLEAAARRARSYRAPTMREQRDRVREEQGKAKVRIRVDRPVKNYEDFRAQMAVWHLSDAEGRTSRTRFGRSKSGRQLEMTLLDTASQTLGAFDDSMDAEDLRDKLGRTRPELFKDTGQIAIADVKLFGSGYRPWVALTFSPEAHEQDREIQVIRHAIVPGLALGDGHVRKDEKHVSLGDLLVTDTRQVQRTFQELRSHILPLLPEYVEFGPARVTVQPLAPER